MWLPMWLPTIIAGRELERPFQLLVDGDLLSLVQKLLLAMSAGTTPIS